MTGLTYLLPKTNWPSENPSKYRPVKCLPTINKIITTSLEEKIYGYLERNKLLGKKQKGCRKGLRGCKEQLVIDAMIMSNAKYSKV